MTDSTAFSPDWVSPPGDTIADLLEERGWTQAELADRTGFTTKHINGLVQGAATVSPEAAEKLARVFGGSGEFWLVREARYRAGLERQRSRSALEGDHDWVRQLPVAWMRKQGWLLPKAPGGPSAAVEEILRWFGVASVDAWRTTFREPLAAFRSSPRAAKDVKQPGAVAAWLRRAEVTAAAVDCRPFDAATFERTLLALRALAAEPNPGVFVPQLQAACASAGVALVLVPAPPGCAVHGATRWLTPQKALLVLTLRHKSNDQLWFSLFHEAAHILKHGKKLLFIEGLEGLDEKHEAEADRFAADLLLPPALAQAAKTLRSKVDVERLAATAGVHPGIVVGRMQREKWLPYTHLNGLKVRYAWDPHGAAVLPSASP